MKTATATTATPALSAPPLPAAAAATAVPTALPTPAPVRTRPRASRFAHSISAAHRQALALTAAATTAALLLWLRPTFADANTQTLPLAAWSGYAWAQVVLVGLLACGSDAKATRHRAQRNDPGAALLFVLVMLAACASLVAVVMAVQTAHALQGATRWTHLALATCALAGSWLLIQCGFALRYARLYYRPDGGGGLDRAAPRHGGLAFPGGHEPDYLDFIYQSAVVGMTSQTSDVAVTSRRMRRLTLGHGLLSFAFNLVVLALAVNVIASALA